MERGYRKGQLWGAEAPRQDAESLKTQSRRRESAPGGRNSTDKDQWWDSKSQSEEDEKPPD